MAKPRWSPAIAIAAGLLCGPGAAAAPEPIAIDARIEGPSCTILRGHAGDLDGIADLLEGLERKAEAEEPVLREILRSERGYEYTVVLPKPAPAPPAQGAAQPPQQPPFFAAPPVARALDRLLVPYFT